jgi:hypothetical protein
LFLIAFLEEAIIINIIIIICINYIIVIYISDNVVININYGRFQDLILVFKIPMDTRKDFSKFVENSVTRAPGSSPAVVWEK